MEENKKNKSYIWIIGVIVIAIIIGAIFFLTKEKPNDNPDEENKISDVTEETKETEEKKYSGETVKYNAYDFIIETMSKAQYWDEDNFLPFDSPEHAEEVKEYLSVNNITGWKLADEDTATFVRGYEGRLWLNFSEYTAKSNDSYAPALIDVDPDGEPYSEEEIHYFDGNEETHKFYLEWLDGASEEDRSLLEASEDGYVTSKYYTREEYEENYYYDCDNFYWIIYDTFAYYESIFKEVGCPLLNQPKGTLASYKNKTINVPIELVESSYTNRNDGLIHAVWDQEDFQWDWGENKDNTWIDNLADIWNQEFPKTYDVEMQNIEHVHLDGTSEMENIDYFGGIYIVRADPTISYVYSKQASLIMSDQYIISGGALATYFLRPLMEKVYGYNVVYFYEDLRTNQDESKVQVIDASIDKKDEFINNTWIADDTVIVIYNKGSIDVGDKYQLSAHITDSDFVSLAKRVNRICEHYGVESPYGQDYLQNLYLYYDIGLQRRLGLR